MNTTNEIVLEKIAESARHNTTVKIVATRNASEYSDALSVECEDHCEEGEIDGYQGERYWGTTESGSEWSVLLLTL